MAFSARALIDLRTDIRWLASNEKTCRDKTYRTERDNGDKQNKYADGWMNLTDVRCLKSTRMTSSSAFRKRESVWWRRGRSKSNAVPPSSRECSNLRSVLCAQSALLSLNLAKRWWCPTVTRHTCFTRNASIHWKSLLKRTGRNSLARCAGRK